MMRNISRFVNITVDMSQYFSMKTSGLSSFNCLFKIGENMNLIKTGKRLAKVGLILLVSFTLKATKKNTGTKNQGVVVVKVTRILKKIAHDSCTERPKKKKKNEVIAELSRAKRAQRRTMGK